MNFYRAHRPPTKRIAISLVLLVLIWTLALMWLVAGCSNETLPLNPEARVLRDFLDERLDSLLNKLKPKLINERYDELSAALTGVPKSAPDLPHLILVLSEKETVLAAKTFDGPRHDLKIEHPIGYDYSKYELINGRTAGKDTFLFCMYRNEGKLLVACRSAWDGIRYAGTVCVALPSWCLPQSCSISERQFIDLEFPDK